MGEILGHVLCGLLSVMVVGKLIEKFSRMDKEIELPGRIGKKEYVMFFLCGAAGYQGISILTVIMLCLSMYLSFMAYTDYYTKKVYSAMSYLMFLVGAFYLFMTTEQVKENFFCILLFGGVILVGFAVKAYAFGDVEIYMALYPYYAVYLFDVSTGFLQVIVWFVATLFLTVVTSIRIKPFGFAKSKAMAPIITFVHVVILFIYHFQK